MGVRLVRLSRYCGWSNSPFARSAAIGCHSASIGILPTRSEMIQQPEASIRQSPWGSGLMRGVSDRACLTAQRQPRIIAGAKPHLNRKEQ